MSSSSFRSLLALLVASVSMIGCDGNTTLSDITVNVTIEGTGTGTVESQSIGVNIDCRVLEGVISGTCSDSFQDGNGGVIRLLGQPDAVTNFSWGGDCRGIEGRTCEVSYAEGEDAIFEVIGNLEAKTVRVILTPKPITMTVAGEEGAVVVSAQALDEDGAEVFGVSFSWTISDSGVATLTPTNSTRQAIVEAVANGSAIIAATAQGVTGQAQVDVSLAN